MLALEIVEINLRSLRYRTRYDDDPVSLSLPHMRIEQSDKGKGSEKICGELPLEPIYSQLAFWDRHHARIDRAMVLEFGAGQSGNLCDWHLSLGAPRSVNRRFR